MEKTKDFTSSEKRILSVLYNAYKHLPTERVAEVAGISRATAKKYLIMLETKDKVECKRIGKSIYWWIKVQRKVRV